MIKIDDYNFFQKLKRLSFIQEIWLYGSRARGDNQSRADIDLAIVCPDASSKDWSCVMEIIEEADTLLKIDCVRFDTLKNDTFKDNIIKFKKVLYKRGSAFMEKEFWKDYFDSLGNALERFEEIMKHPDLDKFDYMHDAAIQRFEFCIELYWKVLKKFLAYEKVEATTPRDVLSKAYQFKFIDNESIWLSMLDDRNRSSHVYKESEAERIFQNLCQYLPVMMKTYQSLKEKF